MSLLTKLKSLLPQSKVDISTRFALLREATQGTMSNFHMARDLRTGKVVGLKILDPAKTAFHESRFKGLHKPSEGEIAVQLKHPHIVETYEHGVTSNGAQYVVMEYLEGPTIRSLLIGRDPRFDGRRLRWIRQAAEAIAAIHAAGFIHRDICPRNLMLISGGEDLKLIDFGLTVPATPAFMQPGNRTGTPNFMAPELVRRKPTDQRLDVFSFGVTAYEICAFELPWTSGATGQVAMTHDKPPTDIRKYRPNINPTLAKAIHWCIEPEMQQRCPSMDRFLGAICKVQHEDGR